MTDGSSSAYLFLVYKKYSHREGPPELGDAGDGFFFFPSGRDHGKLFALFMKSLACKLFKSLGSISMHPCHNK